MIYQFPALPPPLSLSPFPSLFSRLFCSLAITVSHQRAAGWWMSCRLPCQQKVSSTSFHVSAGWLKTGVMVWLPDCSMCWTPAPSTLSAQWVTAPKIWCLGKHSADVLHRDRVRILCLCFSLYLLGYLFSHSCHRRHSVCRDRYQHLLDCVWSQWKHRGNASTKKWG